MSKKLANFEIEQKFDEGARDFFHVKYGNEKFKVMRWVYRIHNLTTLTQCKDFIYYKDKPTKIGLISGERIWDGHGLKINKEHLEYFKCPFYGKKRPEHSKVIQDKLKGVKKTEIHKKNLKIHHGDNYKRKWLFNRGFISKDELLNKSTNEIVHLYGQSRSIFIKSETVVRNKINKFIKSKKYIHDPRYIEFCNKYENTEIIDWVGAKSEMWSIISVNAMNNPNNKMGLMPRFKSEWVENLNYNISKLTRIFAKSSYEKQTIQFFETNKIEWDYENLFFHKPNGVIIPDFQIYIDNIQYIIEIKGYLRNDKHKKIIIDNCNLIVKQLKPSQKFIFQMKPITSKQDLIDNEITKENFNKIKKLIQYDKN